jgi:hypothetical protein
MRLAREESGKTKEFSYLKMGKDNKYSKKFICIKPKILKKFFTKDSHNFNNKA